MEKLDWLNKIPEEDAEQIEIYLKQIEELIAVLDSVSHNEGLLGRFGEEYFKKLIDDCHEWIKQINIEIEQVAYKKIVDIVAQKPEQKTALHSMYKYIKDIDEKIYMQLKASVLSRIFIEPFSALGIFIEPFSALGTILNLANMAISNNLNSLLDERARVAEERETMINELSVDYSVNSEIAKYGEALQAVAKSGLY